MEGGSKGGEEEAKSQGRAGAEAGEGEDGDSILSSFQLSAMQLPITLQTSCWLSLKHLLERPAFPSNPPSNPLGNPPRKQGKQRVDTNSNTQFLV